MCVCVYFYIYISVGVFLTNLLLIETTRDYSEPGTPTLTSFFIVRINNYATNMDKNQSLK